jgi:hypothetical protein
LNNILYANSATAGEQLYVADNSSDPIVAYSDIQGGKDGFGGPGAGANYTGLYEHNIDTDPLFMNTASDDFRPSNSSPCIGTGIDSVEIAGVWYHVPPFCIMGNPRPSPAGSKPDIGACENLLASPLAGVSQQLTYPTEFALYQNYPNPFNPATTISFSLPRKSFVSLKVFDALGREVAVLLADELSAGTYARQWNAAGLASGVYFYKLQAGSYVETKKMLMIK